MIDSSVNGYFRKNISEHALGVIKQARGTVCHP